MTVENMVAKAAMAIIGVTHGMVVSAGMVITMVIGMVTTMGFIMVIGLELAIALVIIITAMMLIVMPITTVLEELVEALKAEFQGLRLEISFNLFTEKMRLTQHLSLRT